MKTAPLDPRNAFVLQVHSSIRSSLGLPLFSMNIELVHD